MKYYIEISDLDDACGYILQSRFFDTEEQAIKWARSITFLDKRYTVSLMQAEWDNENDTYNDIFFVRYLS